MKEFHESLRVLCAQWFKGFRSDQYATLPDHRQVSPVLLIEEWQHKLEASFGYKNGGNIWCFCLCFPTNLLFFFGSFSLGVFFFKGPVRVKTHPSGLSGILPLLCVFLLQEIIHS